MNNQQKRAGQSTRKTVKERHINRVGFVLVTVGGILLILLVAYSAKLPGVGEIGAVGVWVSARVVMDHSDARTKRMIKEEQGTIRGIKGELR